MLRKAPKLSVRNGSGPGAKISFFYIQFYLPHLFHDSILRRMPSINPVSAPRPRLMASAYTLTRKC